MSLNNAFVNNIKRGGRYKSPKYKQYERDVKNQLLQYREDFKKLTMTFNPAIDSMVVDYYFYYKGVLKKDGGISKTGGDTSNFVKPVEDIVFKTLGIDDSFRLGGESFRFESDEMRIVIQFRIYKIKDVFEVYKI